MSKLTRRTVLGGGSALGLSVGLQFGGTVTAAAQQAGQPSYYPGDYAKIVEASKKENSLLIYSNMAEYNWAPVITGFNKIYPWIKVQTLDLGSSEVFTRYNVEAGSNAKSGDLLATGSIEGWLKFVGDKGVMDYKSAEDAKLPDWSKPFPGLYTVSTDPMVLVYNKQVVTEAEWPKSMADLAALIKKDPAKYKRGVTTYNGLASFGEPILSGWLRQGGEKALAEFKIIGPVTVAEESSGTMIAKLSSGEYKLGYFMSGIVVFPKSEGGRGRLLGWHFPEDGTPLVMRSIAVPAKSTHVNAAKLMLDFVVSQAGQTAFGIGGLTPYRDDVQVGDKLRFTYQSITKQLGEKNIILVNYDKAFLEGKPAFEKIWKDVVGD
jgi:iron(III) transport system substrate-binding protein